MADSNTITVSADGSTITVASSQGPQGIQGIQGIQGEQGIQGIQGDPAPTIHSGLTLDDGTNPHATTKTDVGLSNVDNVQQLPLSGGTMSGTIDMGSNAISGATEVTINGIDTYFKAAHTGATGIINGGGLLSINVDTTKFDISAGSGFIVDIFTDPLVPVTTEITWTAFSAITATYAVANNLSWVKIDISGTVIQQDTAPTLEDYREFVVLGVLVHPASSITQTADQSRAVDTYLAEDLAKALGNINLSGNSFSPASTDMTISRAAGSSFCANANRAVNPRDPNSCVSLADSPVTFLRAYNDGAGGVTVVTGQTDIDPDFYDDGSGTLAAVANNKWTNQVCYYIPESGIAVVRYGEETFSSLAGAVAAHGLVPSVIGTGLNPDTIRSVIAVKKGETDLTSIDTDFYTSGRFGLVGG